jgi:hypothetical protein
MSRSAHVRGASARTARAAAREVRPNIREARPRVDDALEQLREERLDREVIELQWFEDSIWDLEDARLQARIREEQRRYQADLYLDYEDYDDSW